VREPPQGEDAEHGLHFEVLAPLEKFQQAQTIGCPVTPRAHVAGPLFPRADRGFPIEAVRKIAALNVERAKAGRSQLKFGLALNVGEIAYGNIGSRTRLDFTAIGPAINHTSRLLEVAKKRNRDIVVSENFVRAAGSEFPNLGYHSLRDIAGEQKVFYIA
jgi:class 3 adenylate cyclase